MTQRYFGPYRIDALIGRGGMGEVYRAFDTSHDREVALKLLPELLATDDEFRRRFQRESRLAARLAEPHVIPIHRYGEIDGRLYLDMRLIRGDDLATVLAREGPLAPARAVALIEQVARALDSAHEEGLVHRDVKPSNVLLAPARPGRPEFAYLGDFGLTRSLGSGTSTRLTATGTTVGTLDYMAPERFLGRDVDQRADIYALGCMLFECLTGRRPFPGEDLAPLMYAHLNEAPPRPSEVRADTPPELDSVVAVGMAKDPGDRYPTAGDLAAAAVRAVTPTPAEGAPPTVSAVAVPPPADTLVGQPARAPTAQSSAPPTLVANVPARRRRRRGLVALTLAVVAAAIAAVVVVAVVGGQQHDTSFGFALPHGYDRSNCTEHPTASADGQGAPQVVTCVGGTTDAPSDASFVRYSVAANAQHAFVLYTTARGIPAGDTGHCAEPVAVSGIWTVDGRTQGTLACGTLPDGVREIVWVDQGLAEVVRIGRADGDVAALWDWWTAHAANG